MFFFCGICKNTHGQKSAESRQTRQKKNIQKVTCRPYFSLETFHIATRPTPLGEPWRRQAFGRSPVDMWSAHGLDIGQMKRQGQWKTRL